MKNIAIAALALAACTDASTEPAPSERVPFSLEATYRNEKNTVVLDADIACDVPGVHTAVVTLSMVHADREVTWNYPLTWTCENGGFSWQSPGLICGMDYVVSVLTWELENMKPMLVVARDPLAGAAALRTCD